MKIRSLVQVKSKLNTQDSTKTLFLRDTTMEKLIGRPFGDEQLKRKNRGREEEKVDDLF